MLRYVRIILFLIFAFAICSSDCKSLDIILSDESSYDAVESLIAKPIILGRHIYEGDVSVNIDELSYLIGGASGDVLSADDIKIALSHLAKKNKFSAIRISCLDHDNGVTDIVWNFTAEWTVKKVKLFGFEGDRDLYQQLYLIKPGERFDDVKHEHSLRAIKERLSQRGYLNAELTYFCERDYSAKSMLVSIYAQCKHQFVINQFDVSIEQDALSHDERFLLLQEIKHMSKHQLLDKPYTKHSLDSLVKSLTMFLAKKGFLQSTVELKEEINFDRATVSILITVDPHTKREFVFFGNHFFADVHLLDIILQFGQSVWLIPLSLLTEELQRAYHRKGFWDVTITSQEEEQTYFFVITENKRARVNKVECKGASNIDTSFLNSTFTAFRKGSFFDIDELKKALDQLTSWYKRHGFWDMKVIKHQCILNDDKGQHTLVLHIQEGVCRYMRRVVIPGYNELEFQEPFLHIANSIEPLPFDLYELQAQRQYLLRYFHEKGFLHTNVSYELIKQDVDGVDHCVVVWNVDKNDSPVRFGKTILSGTGNIPFHRIMRELDYKEGEIWNKNKIEHSFKNVRDLGIFESVHLYPYDLATIEDRKSVMLNVVEDDPFELRARTGVLGVSKNFSYRDGATYKFGGSFIYKNPFLSGGRFCLDGDITRFERRVRGYYQVPWFFGVRLKTQLKGYSNRYKQPIFIGSKETLYEADQHGMLLGMNKPFSKGDIALNYGAEWLKTKKLNTTVAQAINFAPELIDDMAPYVFIEPTIVLDFLDNKLNPTKGAFTLISLKGMASLHKKASSFLKIMAEQSLFVPVGKSVAGLRLRVGHIFNQSFTHIMPPERFYLGGAYSVRGYQTDLAPPIGSYYRGTRLEYVPQGGRTMFNGNLELRFPLFGRLGGTLFQDVGLLVGDQLGIITEEAVVATGLGLRYDTPIGPFRLDLGIRWRSSVQDDSRTAWFFTLGNAF